MSERNSQRIELDRHYLRLGYSLIWLIPSSAFLVALLILSLIYGYYFLAIIAVTALILALGLHGRVIYYLSKHKCTYFSIFTGYRRFDLTQIQRVQYKHQPGFEIGVIVIDVMIGSRLCPTLFYPSGISHIVSILNFLKKHIENSKISYDTFRPMGIDNTEEGYVYNYKLRK
jgi:hypothetical protein